MVGIAELDLLEVLRAERLLLHRRGGVGRDVHLLIGQREGGLPDDEMLAGRQRATVDLLAAEEDRVSGVGQPGDFQPLAVPQQLGVAAGDLVVPGHGPDAAQPAQHDGCPSGSVRRQRCWASMPWAIRSGMGEGLGIRD